MAEGITKVEANDPNRCQGPSKLNGQCPNKAIPNSKYCIMHGGHIQLNKERKERIRNYQLGKYQAALERHTDAPEIKSLRDEIGILRMLLEERFKTIHSETDLMLQTNIISDLITKVEKLVVSCHKLEGSMGQLLDKQALLQFASEIIGIIGEEIEDELVMKRIADKIIASLSKDRTGDNDEQSSINTSPSPTDSSGPEA